MSNEQQIQSLLDRLYQTLSSGNVSPLREILHPEANLILTCTREHAQDREQYLRLWREFLGETQKRSYRLVSRMVKTWGDVAVVRSTVEISYLLERDRYKEMCSAAIVLTRSEGRWQLVWSELFLKAEPA